jgi:preprotein translocase subunit SecD
MGNSLAQDLSVPVNDEAIYFSPLYTSETGENIYPSEIGYVKLKDTAAVMEILRLPKIAAAAPKDLQLIFGEPDKNDQVQSEEDRRILLYCIRTYGRERADLENEDILSAHPEYNSEGQVDINLQFNERGIRIWREMTQKNVDRSIAILIDNVVIIAPRINEPIVDGNSSIYSDYTFEEAKKLCIALLSKKIPAKLTVSDVDIKTEKEPKKMPRQLLFTGIAFLLSVISAFFIIKTLKSS